MRVTLLDLASNSDYFIEVRSKASDQVSRWSPLFHLKTVSDTTPPAPVTGVTVNADGRGFRVTWNAPTLDAAGNPLVDFSHYEVTVTSGVAFGTYRVTQPSLDFVFDMNVALFGSPKGDLTFSVRAVDRTDNKSTAVAATGTNAAPPNVTGLTAVAGTDEINLAWSSVSVNDLSHYMVYSNSTNNSATATAVKRSDTASLNYQTSAYTTDHYFWIKAVDVFGKESAAFSNVVGPYRPRTVFTIDTTGPGKVTGLTLSPASTSLTVSWTYPATNNDALSHKVRYRAGTTAPWDYIDVGRPLGTSAEPWPIITGLMPSTSYTVQVEGYDALTNPSGWTSGTASTSAPGAVANPAGFGGTADPNRITVFWDHVVGADSYEVQLHTNSTYTAQVAVKTVTGSVAVFSSLTPETNYYPRVRAKSGSVNSAWVPATFLLVTTPALGQSTINFGDILGTVGEDQFATNSIRADSLKVDTSITRRLIVGAATYDTSLLPLSTNGELVSGNFYTATGAPTGTLIESGSGFRLTHNSLVINSGTIAAKAIQLQAGANVAPAIYAGFEFDPTAYTGEIAYSASTGAISTAQKRYQTQSLLITSTRASGDATVSYAFMAPTTLDYNIPLDPGSEYIVSGWFYNPTGADINVALRMRHNEAGNYINTGSQIIPPGVWTRLSASGSVGTSTMGLLAVYHYTGAATFHVDGLQVEEKVSGQTAPSAWAPPGSTRLDGGIIRTGEIRSNVNTTEGDVTTPTWSIDTQGTALLGDALVRGRLVVGASGNASNASISVRSWNYAAGSAGWAIAGNGNVEFNDGLFRGSLAAGGTAESPALYVDKTSGNLLAGNVNTGLGTANFKVTGSTGAVAIGGSGSLTIGTKFAVASDGAITASGGTIGGWTIGPSLLSSGNMSLSSSTGITMGSNFSVNNTGYLTASSGTIGGFTFTSTTMTGGNISGANITGSDINVLAGSTTLKMGPTVTAEGYSWPDIQWNYSGWFKNSAIGATIGTGTDLSNPSGIAIRSARRTSSSTHSYGFFYNDSIVLATASAGNALVRMTIDNNDIRVFGTTNMYLGVDSLGAGGETVYHSGNLDLSSYATAHSHPYASSTHGHTAEDVNTDGRSAEATGTNALTSWHQCVLTSTYSGGLTLSSSPSRVSAGSSGWYAMAGTVSFSGQTSNIKNIAVIGPSGGTSPSASWARSESVANATTNAINVSDIRYLSAGDTIALWGYSTQGNVSSSYTRLSVVYLGT